MAQDAETAGGALAAMTLHMGVLALLVRKGVLAKDDLRTLMDGTLGMIESLAPEEATDAVSTSARRAIEGALGELIARL